MLRPISLLDKLIEAVLAGKPTSSTSALANAKATPNGNIKECNLDMKKQQLRPENSIMPPPMYQAPQFAGMQGHNSSAQSINLNPVLNESNPVAKNQNLTLEMNSFAPVGMNPQERIQEFEVQEGKPLLRPEHSTMPPPMYQVAQFTGMQENGGYSYQPVPAASFNFAMGPGKFWFVFPNAPIEFFQKNFASGFNIVIINRYN
uniref:Ataxin-2 C-terminal domain-containing protein n=1 Tax=Mesocestoides corti TaxID=53468 RepID=A0A5K3G2I6_MESCO